jgi:hypothetical protein
MWHNDGSSEKTGTAFFGGVVTGCLASLCGLAALFAIGLYAISDTLNPSRSISTAPYAPARFPTTYSATPRSVPITTLAPRDNIELRVTVRDDIADPRTEPQTLADFQTKLTEACTTSGKCEMYGSILDGTTLIFYVSGDAADAVIDTILPVIKSSVYRSDAELWIYSEPDTTPKEKRKL